jgi:hypothetical protein
MEFSLWFVFVFLARQLAVRPPIVTALDEIQAQKPDFLTL